MTSNIVPAKLLVGNVFPLTLITRRVTIEPISMMEFRACAADAEIHSFWGHANTLAAACAACGVDLTPETSRAVVTTSPEGLPVLDNIIFDTCYLVSPRYLKTFRPEIGEEVPSSMIASWQILKLTWSKDSK